MEKIYLDVRPIKIQTTTRIPQFDAIRGLAALVVFFFHALSMMPYSTRWLQPLLHTPLDFFFNGLAAVTLFFVLSGLVLNLKYARLKNLPPNWIAAFLINRLFRLYPACWVAIVLGLSLRIFVYQTSGMAGMADGFQTFWHVPLHLRNVLMALALLNADDSSAIDPPLWSLVVELRISLIFPAIIYLLSRRWKPQMDLWLLAMVYVIMAWPHALAFRFVPCFVLGAVCAKHFDFLRVKLGKFGCLQQGVWLLYSLLLFEAVSMAEPFPWFQAEMEYVCLQLEALGAAGIILAAVSFKGMAACLATKPFEFIGKTSYSFYLVHMLYLLTAVPWVYRQTHSWVLAWFAALMLSYATAWLMYRFIEKPMIKQGHIFAARWASRQKVVSDATA